MVGFGQTLPRDVPLVQFAAAQGTALVSRPPADRGPAWPARALASLRV